MTRTRKLLFAAGALLGLGLLASMVAKRSPWLSARLREPIQSALAQASGRPVSVGGVGGGLSGWIWLQDVALGRAPGAKAWDLSVTAKAVGLRFDLSDLIRGRTDLAHLKALRVEEPQVFILRGAAEALSASAGSGDPVNALQELPLPALDLDLRSGEAFEDAPGAPLRRLAAGLRLGLEPDETGWRIRGQAELASGGRVALWGRAPKDLKRLELKARANGIQIEPWRDWLGLPAGLGLKGVVGGEVDAVHNAEGAWVLKGDGELSAVAVAWRGRAAVDALQGRWSWDGATLGLDRMQGRSQGGRLEGGLRWRQGQGLDGKLTLKQAGVDGLLALAGAPKSLSLSGKADAELSASAPLSETAWTLGVRAQAAAWGGHALTRFELRAQGQGLSASAGADLAWQGGSARADLSLDPDGLEELLFKAEKLPAAWAASATGGDLKGDLDADLRYRRLDGQEPWELNLRSASLSRGSVTLQALHASVAGGAQALRARVEADLPQWKGLNGVAEAQRNGEAWDLKRLRIFERDHLRAEASGRRSGEDIDLDLHSVELPMEALRPWLPASLQALSGTVQGKGSLHWRPAGGSGLLSLDAPSLSAGGQGLPASAQLRFAPGAVSFSALSLRGGELSGGAGAPAWAGPWDAELKLHGAKLAPWMALLGVPGALSGTANGGVTRRGNGGLSADLDLDEPWPHELPKARASLRLRANGSQWHLERLELRQGGGSLDAQGGGDLDSAASWKGEARWSGLRWRGELTEGQALLKPGSAGPQLALGPWSLSQTALPAVLASLRLEQRRVNSAQLGIGERTLVELKPENGAWRARAELKGEDPAALLGPWFGHQAKSGLALSGWIEGRLGGGATGWKASLDDDALAGSRLELQSREDGGLASARWTQLDLARWERALAAAGLASVPGLAGLSSGEIQALAGGLSASAKVSGFKLAGADFGPAELHASSKPGQWSLDRFDAGNSGAELHLAHWKLQQGPAAWTAEGELAMQQIPASLFELGAEGKVKLSGQAGHGSAELRLKSLQVSERRYQDLVLKSAWDQGRVTVSEASRKPGFKAAFKLADGAFELTDLQAVAGTGKAWLKGGVAKDGTLAFDGGAQAFPAGELTGWLGWPQEWSGAAYGSLALSGKAGAVRGVISARIEDGSVAGLPFDLASGLVHLEPDWVQLSPLRPIRLSRKNGVALEVTGKVPQADAKGRLPGPLEVDAELKDGGLGLFAGLPAIQAASGALELSLHFSGNPDDPGVQGRIRVKDGSLTPAWLLPPLEHVELFGQLDDGQFILQKAEGQVAGGGPLLKLETAAEGKPAFVFERWVPAAFNLRLRSSKSGLPLRSTAALKFIDGQAHPDLRLSGTWDQPVLEGELSLERGSLEKAVVVWPAQFAAGPKRIAPASESGGSFLDALRYDVRLLARQDVMVRTEAAQVFIDTGPAGLRLSGAGDERELEGRLRFTRGNVDYLLASFQLATDKETFVGFRPGAAPELELWGTKRVRDALLNGESVGRDVDLRLHAFGPLGEVQMLLEADDSNLTQQQLASLAGLGVDASDPRSQGGFVRMLGKVPARFLTNLLRRTGVVDEVGLRSQFLEDAVAGARATPVAGEGGGPLPVTGGARTLVAIDAGKYLGEKLYVGGSVLVNEKPGALPNAPSEVNPAVGGKVEYELKRNTRLSAQQNVDTNGQAEQRVMLERTGAFENYNPRKRRWDRTPTPGPTPPEP
jgi:hypothetical protein